MTGSREKWRWLWGRHSVEEALLSQSRKIREFWILHEMKDERVSELVKVARELGAKVRWVQRKELDRMTSSAAHQGLALMVEERAGDGFAGFLGNLNSEDRKTLILTALDQIQDPHNLGAIARSAVCLGSRALIVPDRRAAPVTPAAVASSAGAIEKIPVFTVGNLAQTLTQLKDDGFWIYGADGTGKAAWDVQFNFPMVLVIGSEGFGMRRMVAERCDELVGVPQSAQGVESLNASCAASILLYEVTRRLKNAAAGAKGT
ncbi:MAG: 23S rRNA (guanosine(2251)-2'-O)-methyltransferase RlmB [Elusimicrobia bacterium]|nr:23S rRNA (guanosine(2251)-2'-O)-methyltransferase RlmB [Elusimicrobiota bacterium]